MLHNLPDPVIVIDDRAHLLWANHRAERVFGMDLELLRGRPVAEMVHPDDLISALRSLETVQEKTLGTSIEIRIRRIDGNWIPVEIRGWSGLHDAQVRGVVVSMRLTADRGGWNLTAGDARRHAAVLDQAPHLTLLLDSHGRLVGANRAFTIAAGSDLESSLGRYLADLVQERDAPRVRAEIAALLLDGQNRSFEATLIRPEGSPPVPYWLTAADLLADEAVRAIVVSGVAIPNLVATRERLAHQASHDPLTDLTNRRGLLDHLNGALQASVGTPACVGLILCDIDDFKVINDSHGHVVGDEVLVEVAHRIRTAIGADDAAGRIGGDEMVVVTVRDTVEEVEAMTAALVAAVELPLETAAGVVRVRLSAGCAVARQGARAEELLRRADQAMYSMKRRRRADPSTASGGPPPQV